MITARIDAHMHLWRFADVAESWIASSPAWARDFSASDYVPLLTTAGLDRAILVQAVEDEAETTSMLALANEQPWVAGVIGWLDLGAPEAATRVACLASAPHALGVRNWPMIYPDPHWLARPALDAGFRTLADSTLRYDVLAKPENLPALRKRMARTPDLRVCIDHCAYPLPEWRPDGAEQQAWIKDLSALADLGCVVKLSGFGHRCGGTWQPEIYDRFVSRVFEVFGSKQVIWASNWPTVLAECSFEAWMEASIRWTACLSELEKRDVFGGTAVRFYGLGASSK